jgi:hypothetical protein
MREEDDRTILLLADIVEQHFPAFSVNCRCRSCQTAPARLPY